MDLQDLGAIGDLVGGLGVVVSLVYVASQIRQSSELIQQNSRHLEAAMYQQTADAFSRWMALMAQDPTLADLWGRGLGGEKLASLERARFRFLLGMLFNAYENNFFQLQFGSLRRDTLNLSRATLVRILGSPEGASWWRQWAPSTLTPEFRSAVETVAGGPIPASAEGVDLPDE